MAPPEVHKNLLADLEAMGFSEPRAINALHFSGNTSVEAAIDWIIDHDKEANIDQMPLVILDIPIEEPNPSSETEPKCYALEWKVKKEEERRAKERKAERMGRVTLPDESPMRKSNMSINQKKNNMELAESARKVEFMQECLRSLRRQNIGHDAQVKTAFQTLLIYVTNVANSPENVRFRRIHLNNPTFQKRVGKFKQGVEFLELCGFVIVEEGDQLLLFLLRDNVDMGLLKAASALLHSAITNPFFGLLSRPTCDTT